MSIPEEFKCLISSQIMLDPVICENGYTYDRSSLHNFDTGNIIPNLTLKNLITRYIENNKINSQNEEKKKLPIPANQQNIISNNITNQNEYQKKVYAKVLSEILFVYDEYDGIKDKKIIKFYKEFDITHDDINIQPTYYLLTMHDNYNLYKNSMELKRLYGYKELFNIEYKNFRDFSEALKNLGKHRCYPEPQHDNRFLKRFGFDVKHENIINNFENLKKVKTNKIHMICNIDEEKTQYGESLKIKYLNNNIEELIIENCHLSSFDSTSVVLSPGLVVQRETKYYFKNLKTLKIINANETIYNIFKANTQSFFAPKLKRLEVINGGQVNSIDGIKTYCKERDIELFINDIKVN